MENEMMSLFKRFELPSDEFKALASTSQRIHKGYLMVASGLACELKPTNEALAAMCLLLESRTAALKVAAEHPTYFQDVLGDLLEQIVARFAEGDLREGGDTDKNPDSGTDSDTNRGR